MTTAEVNAQLRKLIDGLQNNLRTAVRLECSDEVRDGLQAAIDELEDAYIVNANYLNS